MKNFILALAMVSSVALFSACVNRNANKDTGLEPTEFDCSSDIFVGDARSRDAVDFYSCRIAGIKSSEFVPDMEGVLPHYSLDYYGASRCSVIRFKKDEAITSVDKESYVRKVYEACRNVADGKKCIYGFERTDDKVEANAELPIDELVEITDFSEPVVGFGYKRNGKYVFTEVYFNDDEHFLAVSVSPGRAMSLEDAIKVAEGLDTLK